MNEQKSWNETERTKNGEKTQKVREKETKRKISDI